MNYSWNSLDPASKGFVAVSVGLIVLTLLVWLLLGKITAFLSPKPVQSASTVCEPSEWINFIISHVAPHFQNKDSLRDLEKLISSKISPRSMTIHSLGNPPEISDVTTLEPNEADDIRLLIPVDWKDGPSIDVKLSRRLGIEFDLHAFKGSILINWPGSSDRRLDIGFNKVVKFDFDLALKLFNSVKISLTEVPFMGAIVKAVVSLVLSRRQFRIDLPAAPNSPNS